MSDEPTHSPDGKHGRASQWLLISSSIANLLFAGLAAYTSYRNTTLDAEKKVIENQLLLERNRPTVSTFYVTIESSTLRRLLSSKEPLPFSPEIKNYRFAQNEVFDQFSADIAGGRVSRREGTLTFLSIANVSDVSAYAVSVHTKGSAVLSLSDLDPKTAILVAISYKTSVNSAIEAKENSYTRLQYDMRAAGGTRVDKAIPAPGSMTWSAQIGNVKSWGRAMPSSESDPLLDLSAQENPSKDR